MNKLIILSLGILLLSLSSCTNRGGSSNTKLDFIHNVDMKYDDMLKKAGEEGKLVFLDFYADWCGPCKQMNKSVFTNTSLKKYYEENFISYKINVDKGEGRYLSLRYMVAGYPTMIFVNPKGEILENVVGYRTAPELIKEGKRVLSKHPK